MTYSAGTQATQHLPDALIVGAPKADTTALHAALARHPQVHASPVKEPKFYLCGEAPPPAFCGPGDAHRQQEWIWRRDDYEKLFTDAPKGQVRLESTPFYVDEFDDDITLLENITGEDFSDWRSATGRGSYKQRIDG